MLVAFFSLLLALPSAGLADITLSGAIHLGDNDSTSYTPRDPITYRQIQNYPIHFQLTEAVTITEVDLVNVHSLEPDGHVEVFIDGTSRGQGANGSGNVNIGAVTLSAGLHTIAFGGQCYSRYTGQALNHCSWNSEEDDFDFTAILLKTSPASVTTMAVNFIQRRHLGDDYDSNDNYDPTDVYPFYPDAPEGSTLSLAVPLIEATTALRFDFYRLRSLDRNCQLSWDGTTLGTLVPGGDSVDLADDPYTLNHTFSSPQAAGTHTLTITIGNIGPGNDDDISWDELIVWPTAATPSNVDHYEIWHDGQGLTCQAETVTVKACQNPDCSTLYTGTVTVTMSPSFGWVNGNTRTFSGGSLDLQFRQSTPGIVTLGIASADPAASYLCRENGIAGDCTIEFANSGFIFSIPTQIANKTSSPISLTAANRSGSSRRCRDAFTAVTRNIIFLLSYINPTTGTMPITINSTTVPAGVPTPVPISFNANGDATFTVKYSDAGQIRLDLSYTDRDTTLDGYDTFVVRPAGLCVASPDPNADCASLNGSCTKFKKAGEAFNLRVKGVQWVADSENNSDFCDNVVTPNFSLNHIALSLNLVAPAGGNTGSLGQSSITIPLTDHGSTTITNQSISEVGVFAITATPPDYLVPGVIIPASTSAAIGRFYPDQFTTAVVANGTLTNLCNGFTYTGQPFSYGTRPQLAIAAWNTLLGQVQNYRDDFRKFTINNLNLTYPSRDTLQNGADNTNKVAVLSVPDPATALITDTVVPLTVTLGNDTFTYTRTLPTDTDQARIGPFTAALAISVNSLTDSDGVTTAAGDLPKTIMPAGNSIRYGQGIIQNTAGPENEALTMPFFALYYNGSGWVTNTLDNCTLFAYTKVENGTIVVSVTPPSPVLLTSGTASITLTPTSDPSPPGGTVTINGNVPAWLEPDPVGEATFGIWRGNNRIINWKEIQR